MTASPVTAIRRVAETEDQDRLACATALFNAFNDSVRRLGGRQTWTSDDFAKFGVVIQSMDDLKPCSTDYARRERPVISAAAG